MPYGFETHNILLPEGRDRRVKLNDEQRAYINQNPEQLSQRALAKMFNVSRRLVSFIQDPAKYAKNLECRKARGGWKQYYSKHEHRESMKNTRRYKAKIINADKEGCPPDETVAKI